MNAQEFAPDNNSASKLNKSQIIVGFLITDQQFTKTIEKRVFNDPTAGPEVWVTFQFLLFLAAGTNMGRITMRLHLFTAARIASIQTQILRVFFIRFWTQRHYMIQGIFQQFDIVCIGSGKNNCQRKAVFHPSVHCVLPPFFPRSVGFFPTASRGQRRFHHAAVQTLPFPADSFQLFIFFQTFGPYSFKKSCRCPFLKILVDAAGCSVFFGHCFPLATRS